MNKKKTKKARKLKSRIKLYRRTLQTTTALAFILIPWLNSKNFNLVSGNFLSFKLAEFSLADPLAVLQITLKNAWISTDLIIGALIALGIAFCLGAVFCSWICPFGLLSELGQSVSKQLMPKKNKKQNTRNNAFIIKMIIFISGFMAFFLFSTTPILNQLSMPAWYSRIFQFIFIQKYICFAIFVMMFILTAEIVFQNRLWCRYFCPQSVLLILVKQLNPARLTVNFKTDKCFHPKTGKEPCHRACNIGLNPKKLANGNETDCINCGDCIVACSLYGEALNFKFNGRNRGAEKK